MAGGLLLERVARGASARCEQEHADRPGERGRPASERAIRELLAERRPQDGFLGEEGGAERARRERADVGGRSAGRDGQLPLRDSPVVCERRGARRRRARSRARCTTPTATSCSPPTRDGAARRRTAGAERRGARRAARAREDLGHARWWPRASPTTRGCARPRRRCWRGGPRVRDVRRFGSAALDLAWTAAGRYDAYFERTVKPWDIAAGALVCERAGPAVLELPARERLPWGILAAAPALVEALMELVGAPPGCIARARCVSPHAPVDHAAGGSRTHTPCWTRPFEGPASTVPPPPQDAARRRRASPGSGGLGRRVGVEVAAERRDRGARAPRSSPG